MGEPIHDTLETALRDPFGLSSFRPGQRDVIEAVLSGRDVLCVMPTGGGKSLCYQLPAIVQKGLTLVVSPLIALMKDQVDSLHERGIRATLINSSLDPEEQRARIVEAELGRYDLLYVAPERFRSPRFVEAMSRVRPALLAVDEAHCISEWGHDFRPDYMRLGEARARLGMPVCIALTATATDLVRDDITRQLQLREPALFVTGFDRPNLSYAVVPARREVEKLASLGEVLEQHPGSAIVYTSSRKRCEDVAMHIQGQLRRRVVVYHAGMERGQRHEAQERFMNSEADVVVATNAFGMGVDKPDIRAVVHYNLPGTLEAYYQEAGRAGRDGQDSACVLLYAQGDIKLQKLFIESSYPPRDVIFRVYEYLRGTDADPIQLSQAEIREALDLELGESAVGSALKILDAAGAIERFDPRENMAIVRIRGEGSGTSYVDRVPAKAAVQRLVLMGLEGIVHGRFGEPVYFHPDEFATALGLDRTSMTRALRSLTSELPIDYIPPFRGQAIRVLDRGKRARDLVIDFEQHEARKKHEYAKLDRMIDYAESRQCRRAVLLSYFGDPHPRRCGRCDRCGMTGGRTDAEKFLVETAEARITLMKILSGVARTKGRFGKTVVVQMLTGSGSERIRDSWVARLSTYGVLAGSGFTQAEISRILDSLIDAGLVESRSNDNDRPLVAMTETGWAWLKARGESPIMLALPQLIAAKLNQGGGTISMSRPSAEPEGGSIAESADVDRLLEALRDKRTEWARAAGLPPSYVLSNETLELLARERPESPAALGRIKGIGPSKLEKYGEALLAIIASASTETADALADPPERPEEVCSEEWTCRLLDRGFSIREAALIRGMALEAVAGHVQGMMEQGRPVPIDRLFEPEEESRQADWLAHHGPERPPKGVPAAVWALFVACQAGRGEA